MTLDCADKPCVQCNECVLGRRAASWGGLWTRCCVEPQSKKCFFWLHSVRLCRQRPGLPRPQSRMHAAVVPLAQECGQWLRSGSQTGTGILPASACYSRYRQTIWTLYDYERAAAAWKTAQTSEIVYALYFSGGGLFCDESISLNRLLQRCLFLHHSFTRFISYVYLLSDASCIFLKLYTGYGMPVWHDYVCQTFCGRRLNTKSCLQVRKPTFKLYILLL